MAKVKIPIKIASEANNNDHWRLKSKRHKIQKAIVRSYMKTIVTPPLPCKIILKCIAPRKFDFDNLCISFKWILDQLCDILIPGLAPGRADADSRIQVEYLQEKSGCEEYAIEIEFIAL